MSRSAFRHSLASVAASLIRPCRLAGACWLVLVALLAGCDGSLSDSLAPEGTLLALHAAQDLSEVRLTVEDRPLGDIADVDFSQATRVVRVGEDTYSFAFRRILPGDTQFTDILRFSQVIGAERQHIFVLSGSAAQPELLVWVGPEAEFPEDTVLVAAAAGHAAQGAPAVDVYLGAPGLDPVAALAGR